MQCSHEENAASQRARCRQRYNRQSFRGGTTAAGFFGDAELAEAFGATAAVGGAAVITSVLT